MDLSKEQLAGKPKKVGTLGSKPVFALVTKGGYNLIVVPKGPTSYETLAVGPHKAVAKHIAAKLNKEIKWTELSKSEDVDPASFAHLLPKYEQLTSELRKKQENQ